MVAVKRSRFPADPGEVSDGASLREAAGRAESIGDRLGISSILLGEIDTLAPVVERLAGS